MNLKRELTKNLLVDENLVFHPLKDILSVLFSLSFVVVIILVTYFSLPQSSESYVQIKYANTFLYDLNDPNKRTNIPFPEMGTHVISYTREDGEIFLGEGNYFQFYGEMMEVTIYADKSIEITKEDSPRHICSSLGRSYSSYAPLICLPNYFQVSIVMGGLPEWDA